MARTRTSLARQSVSKNVRIQWFIDNVTNTVRVALRNRMKIATSLVKNSVIKNISVPVVKVNTQSGGSKVVERSKRGEFPRADSTKLMRTLITDVRTLSNGDVLGHIGTPQAYSIPLELELERQFLTRTLFEELPRIKRILLGPIEK